ncbi:hypothetical protein D3C86_1098150 [compost metagenome]
MRRPISCAREMARPASLSKAAAMASALDAGLNRMPSLGWVLLMVTQPLLRNIATVRTRMAGLPGRLPPMPLKASR